MKIIDFNPAIRVLVTGQVLGYIWGGSMATTECKQFVANSEFEAIKIAKERIENNTLTGTSDFSSSIGANVCLHVITSIQIEGKTFENIEYNNITIGDLTENQAYLLEQEIY